MENFKPGMTNISLRAYFAGQAMMGDWASQKLSERLVIGPDYSLIALQERAKLYIAAADALILELGQVPPVTGQQQNEEVTMLYYWRIQNA